MSPDTWQLLPCDARPGSETTIKVVERAIERQGRIVCIIEGQLSWNAAAADFARPLDEKDVENARVIAAAPRMLRALEALRAWSERMGEWDAPCWREAETALEAARGPEKPRSPS